MSNHEFKSLLNTGLNQTSFYLVSIFTICVSIILISITILPTLTSASSIKCHQSTTCKKELMNVCGKLISEASSNINATGYDSDLHNDSFKKCILEKLSPEYPSWQQWLNPEGKPNVILDKRICIRSDVEAPPSPSVYDRCRASIHVVDLEMPNPHAEQSLIVNVSAVVKLYKGAIPLISSGTNAIDGGLDEELFMVFHMEGVYVEARSKDHGTLCMVGRSSYASGQDYDNKQDFPCLSCISQIMNVHAMLHFPYDYSLTSRSLHGFLASTSAVSHPQHFDPIFISMVQTFGPLVKKPEHMRYDYSKSANLVSVACPSTHTCSKSSNHMDHGTERILFIDNLGSMNGYKFTSLWTEVSNQCTKIPPASNAVIFFGPFAFSRSQAESFHPSHFSLVLEDFTTSSWLRSPNGVTYTDDDADDDAAAVFRLISDDSDMYGDRLERIQPWDEFTIVAQGRVTKDFYKPRDQVCMLGCRRSKKHFLKETDIFENLLCDCRICLMWQPNLSLKHRSTLKGTISSLNTDSAKFCPLHFEYNIRSVPSSSQDTVLLERLVTYQYNISNYCLAQNPPAGLLWKLSRLLKAALLTYPAIIEVPESNHYYYGESANRVVQSSITVQNFKAVMLHLVSVDKKISLRGWSNHVIAKSFSSNQSKAENEEGSESCHIALIAGTISLYQEFNMMRSYVRESKKLVFNVEGVYDARFGELMMNACKQVSGMSLKFMQQYGHVLDNDGQLDCKVHIRIQYAPAKFGIFATLLGPFDQKFTVTVTSTRDPDDPFFFPEIRLKLWANDIGDFSKYLLLKGTELRTWRYQGLVAILGYVVTLCCLAYQRSYLIRTKKNMLYMSVLMLVILGLGFMMALIRQPARLGSSLESMEAEVMRFGLSAEEADTWEELLRSHNFWAVPLEFFTKALAAIGFVMTIQLGKLVCQRRVGTLNNKDGAGTLTKRGRAKNIPISLITIFRSAIATERKSAIILIILYSILGYLITTLYINTDLLNCGHLSLGEYLVYTGNFLLDLLLLPQIIFNSLIRESVLGRNVLKQNKRKKVIRIQPLHMCFYFGLTALRSVPAFARAVNSLLMTSYVGPCFWQPVLFHLGTTCVPITLAILLHLQQTV